MVRRFLVLVLVLSFTANCFALSNPAAVYCGKLGYDYESGVCVTSDGTRLDAWDFYRGKAGGKYSYCAKKGYGTESEMTNEGSYSIERAVCVGAAGGKKIPMLDLMAADGNGIGTEDVKPSFQGAAQDSGKSVLSAALPSSFDWRNYNGHSYIGPVRDQGNCGSCYSFGALAAAEGTFNYVTGSYDNAVSDFSESYMIWCLARLPQYSSHFYGCSGADYEYKELEALTLNGIADESSFPYTITDPGVCTHWSDLVTTFSSWSRVASGNIEPMKQAIMTHGVIDVAVYAGSKFQAYRGGVYSDTKTTCPLGYYTTSNHAVALVGWGSDPVFGNYWILRNSWSPSWGENGYMRIAMNAARVTCAPAYLTYGAVTTTTLPPTTTTSTTQTTTTTIQILPTCTGTQYPSCSGLERKACGKAYEHSILDNTYHQCAWNSRQKTCQTTNQCLGLER